jgi:redox-sensitive bicupin YhaK (pirin superfamily)
MGHLSAGEKLSIEPQRCLPHGWVQIINGSLSLEGHSLSKADGLSFENQNRFLSISAGEETQFFFFRLG